MGWVKRKKDQHVCALPPYETGVAVSDVWQCDECGKKWIVVDITDVTPLERPTMRWMPASPLAGSTDPRDNWEPR